MIESKLPIRLFRADTPHDVVSACLVASQAPARDFLAFSMDKAAPKATDYKVVMEAISACHPWEDVFDISGLPMNDHWLRPQEHVSRLARYRAMARSYKVLRDAVEARLIPESVDDVFIVSLDHPDIQLFTQVLPRARVSLYPHGLGSIHALENETFSRWTGRVGPIARRKQHMARILKQAIWGPGATPPISFDVTSAYTFNRYPAVGRRRYDLRYLITRETLADLFGALPAQIREVYETAAAGEPSGLLLLYPSDVEDPAFPHELETWGFVEFARHLVATYGVQRLIIKPHPRNGRELVERQSAAIKAGAPGVAISVIDQYPSVPIELAAGAMDIVAGAGLGSTSLHTLSRVYSIPMYSSDELLQTIAARLGQDGCSIEKWIKDNRGAYASLDLGFADQELSRHPR